MENFKISVNIKIESTEEKKNNEPMKMDDGLYEIIIDREDGLSIDKTESALTRSVYPALRDGLSAHFSKVSEQAALENARSGEVIVNPRLYRVDSSVGRFEFKTHSVFSNDLIQYNTATDLFQGLTCKEFYRTIEFKEYAMIYGDTGRSYRETAEWFNHIRHQEKNGTPYRTLQSNTEKEAAKVIDHMTKKSEGILVENEFAKEGVYQGDKKRYLEDNVVTLPQESVSQAARKICENNHLDEILENPVEEMLDTPVPFEDPVDTTNVCVDDVNVKKQEEKRRKIVNGNSEKERKRKYVHNTIAHVESDGQKYVLNGGGIKKVLFFLIAFFFNNRLIGKRFQFFTDGHSSLNKSILKHFSWYRNIGIILDWFHLVKKCKEKLSMALKGREIRNQVLRELMPLLWNGLTNKAISLLEDLDSSMVKNATIKSELVTYLERNRSNIPCYSVRKQLGLRNSSAIGEKMNDLAVSKRQKHNGMSWSKTGSVALATITCLKLNNEYKRWFEAKELSFNLV